ncbi:hypothetical protein [Kordia jejudonensis]|uniref:hypothetical protein n=1 Tax=Kordia jejudonensis TaxID=1348245 RepID=UPI00062973B1|nr:hypothetical protein [Kordia jejudonensis]
MNSLSFKLTNPKKYENLVVKENTGRLQIKKVILNKALKSYIQDNYESGVHFGSMNNNLKEILHHLSLDTIMESSLKLPLIDVNKFSSINEYNNEFSNFDLYETFVCTFVAKEGVSSAEFMKGIKKLETSFLNIYNEQANKEFVEIEHLNREAIKKREMREIIFFVIIFFIAILGIYLFSR